MQLELSHYIDWTGSQDELVDLVRELEPLSIKNDQPITKRTFVYYRGKGVISPAHGKKYCYLHLVQCLATRKLLTHGWTVKQLVQLISNADESKLVQVALGEIEPDAALDMGSLTSELVGIPNNFIAGEFQPAGLPLPILAVHMLAMGVCDTFNRVIDEHKIVTGNDIPFSLQRAMGLLGRLCLEESKEDVFASIHNTLALCKLPFNHSFWPISAFKATDFELSSVNLIDKDHRCPTQDCIELAGGRSEANIKEQFSFELLIQLCSVFGGQKHKIYKLVREFIGRHPITSVREITEFSRLHSISKIDQFLSREVYSPMSSHILIDGLLYTCKGCGAPIRKVYDGLASCIIRQCPSYGKHVNLTSGNTPADDCVVLSPHLLSFWFGPSIDELEIYDLAKKCGLEEVQLYPESDACDVSIDGYDIGIDVKSYSSPYLLAHSLNRSVGRLSLYAKKIIAISDESISRHKDYLSVLKRHYKNDPVIDFRSVSSLKNWIRGVQ